MMTKTKNSSGKGSSAYPNYPRVAVGAIVFHRGRVLLVWRGKPPALGVWAVPGGKVDLGETLQKAAEREIFEETGVVIQAREPVFTFDVIVRDDNGQVQFHYVIVDLIADYVSGDPRAGDDALDARWVSSHEIKQLKVNATTRKLLRQQFEFGI
ncbi:Hydrolase, NUDIX family [Desulfonema magnum]|uniref:Hydrolase, NUDIX family n=2 Tax=Desulfonema magnum TaxID=45655 RepID=A0A975GUA2_9BACT|nr:Hydrolase, NUDIX family [Desulfonema magnum]